MSKPLPDYVTLCERLIAIAEEAVGHRNDGLFGVLKCLQTMDSPDDLRSLSSIDLAVIWNLAVLGGAYLGRRRQELATLEGDSPNASSPS